MGRAPWTPPSGGGLVAVTADSTCHCGKLQTWVVGWFYFLGKQRSGRKCLVSGSDGQVFCSTEMFSEEMLREFSPSVRVGRVGGRGLRRPAWGGGHPRQCWKRPGESCAGWSPDCRNPGSEETLLLLKALWGPFDSFLFLSYSRHAASYIPRPYN